MRSVPCSTHSTLRHFSFSQQRTQGSLGILHPQHSFLTFLQPIHVLWRIVIDAFIHPEQIVPTPTSVPAGGFGMPRASSSCPQGATSKWHAGRDMGTIPECETCVQSMAGPQLRKRRLSCRDSCISEGGHGQEMVLQNGDLLCFKFIPSYKSRNGCIRRNGCGNELRGSEARDPDRREHNAPSCLQSSHSIQDSVDMRPDNSIESAQLCLLPSISSSLPLSHS